MNTIILKYFQPEISSTYIDLSHAPWLDLFKTIHSVPDFGKFELKRRRQIGPYVEL